MNCNTFKKRLEDYVLGNISNDLKFALENHMDECENCKILYEEEYKLDTAFKMALSIDGIQFNSSRAGIISAIDKNRYSKKTSNKILYNFKRHKNRYLTYAVAVMAMIVFIPMLLKGIGGGPYKSEKSNNAAIYKATEENNTEDSMKMGKSQESVIEDTVKPEASKENVKEVNKEAINASSEFKSSIITDKELPDFEMVWKISSDGKNTAAIDTRKEQDVDFGIHAIYVKNIDTNKIVKYEVADTSTQYTPRNIEWWDNEHLIVVTGYAFGTISHGSNVYSLEANTGKFSSLYQVKDQKHQILDVNKEKNDLMLQLIIYDDDNYMTSHKAVGKMTLLEPDKPVEMLIISEDKK